MYLCIITLKNRMFFISVNGDRRPGSGGHRLVCEMLSWGSQVLFPWKCSENGELVVMEDSLCHRRFCLSELSVKSGTKSQACAMLTCFLLPAVLSHHRLSSACRSLWWCPDQPWPNPAAFLRPGHSTQCDQHGC